MASGVKRKHDEMESDAGVSYQDQRQSILNISMVKLRHPMTSSRHDTSLRRSVLIFNTLRHIESELKQEGVTLSPSNKPLLPSLQPITDVEMDPRPASEADIAPATPRPDCQEDGCHDVQERTLQRLETMEISSAAVPPASSLVVGGPVVGSPVAGVGAPGPVPPVPAHTPLPPADTLLSDTKYLLDSLLNCERLTVSSFASIFEMENTSSSPILPSLPACQTTSSTTSPSNTPSNQVQCTPVASLPGTMPGSQGSEFTDALGDLDFDFDLFMPLTSKLTPLSAEELMHTLPSGGDPFPGVTQNPSPCTHKNELLTDELDHVMQVLRVGGI